MRGFSALGSPKWYRRDASYSGITGMHHHTHYSNSHRIEGKIAYFMEHQPSASVSCGRRLPSCICQAGLTLYVGECLESLTSSLELGNVSRSRNQVLKVDWACSTNL
jgi:hypothetical protein